MILLRKATIRYIKLQDNIYADCPPRLMPILIPISKQSKKTVPETLKMSVSTCTEYQSVIRKRMGYN